MRRIFMAILALTMATAMMAGNFVKVKNGRFVRGGKPYYYVGANFWYGAVLGSEGSGGNRARLRRELDEMQRLGIDNLRILVGADGLPGVEDKIEPVLQSRPGVYNDSILAGLDYLLTEMSKIPRRDGYGAYTKFASKFASNQKAHLMFYDHIRFILSRTNRYSGLKYVDDPTIMSWQICNEPRAFSKEALPEFEKWLSEATAIVRSLDKNHLISLGSEGAFGCERDYGVFERICADKNVDYCNVHIWPYNWQWARKTHLKEDLEASFKYTQEYIDSHLAICNRLNKPLVLEEFGYPRDGFSFSLKSTTKARDAYYKYVLNAVAENAAKGGLLVGCNFWGWGGYAKPRHERWQAGDDFTSDPAHEPQGFYSVYVSDKSTLKIIQKEAKRMSEIK